MEVRANHDGSTPVLVIFLTKDNLDRYLFAAPLLVVGLMVSLARWNDV